MPFSADILKQLRRLGGEGDILRPRRTALCLATRQGVPRQLRFMAFPQDGSAGDLTPASQDDGRLHLRAA